MNSFPLLYVYGYGSPEATAAARVGQLESMIYNLDSPEYGII